MRSSKSRSRNKSNRQRSIGNIINRVFDSSGPEGKVRGTPQQIIDKYLALARDAQLGNDRVAEQNFLQHAEHYTRMLGEAQREVAREQERGEREAEARYDDVAPMPEPMSVEDEGPGLVETPEMNSEPAPDVAPAIEAPVAEAPQGLPEAIETTDEAEGTPEPAAEKAPRPRTRRGPRKPRGEEASVEAQSDAAGE
jgi:hypothetical protein